MKLLLSLSAAVVSGSWGEWEEWQECRGLCHQGRQTRYRQCTTYQPCEDECQNQPGENCSEFETRQGCALPSCDWEDWSEWGSCTLECGGGTQQRQRQCPDQRPDHHCGDGDTVEEQACNEALCETYYWGNYGEWSACSKECGGGLKRRYGSCFAESTNQEVSGSFCTGSSYEETDCNEQKCPVDANCGFNSWKNYYPVTNDWFLVNRVVDIKTLNQCAFYCESDSSCKGFRFWTLRSRVSAGSREWAYCYTLSETESISGVTCAVGTDCENRYSTYYTQESWFGLKLDVDLDTDVGNATFTKPTFMACPDASSECSTVDNNRFGTINYMDTTKEVYYPAGQWQENMIEKYTISRPAYDGGQLFDCRNFCFTIAGCFAYYINDKCNIVMGHPTTVCSRAPCAIVDDVIESGRLSWECPNRDTLATSYTKKSTIYCKFLTQLQEDDLVQRLKDANGITSSTPLGSWIYTSTRTSSKAQLTDLFVNHPTGVDNTDTQASFTWIQFTFETHTRTKVDSSGGVGRREAENELVELDSDLINSLLNNLNVPDEAEVVETTEVEVLEVSQLSPDGEVAADCSSGTCECADGYEDNGDGCERTPDPASSDPESLLAVAAAVETETVVLDAVEVFTTKINQNVENKNRRKRLSKAWEKIQKKLISQYSAVDEKCSINVTIATRAEFSEDFCQSSAQAEGMMSFFTETFTNDCRKTSRGTNLKFHERLSKRINKLSSRTKNTLGVNCSK